MERSSAINIKIDSIKRSPTNPRKNFDKDSLATLAENINAKGITFPITVRNISDPGFEFELVAGERRILAARLTGVQVVPAYVVDMTDEEAARAQLIEFEQAVDISPMEKAEAFLQLLDRGDQSLETISSNIGKSKSYIVKMINLTRLIEPAKKALKAGALPLGHALLICRQHPKDQKRAFEFALKSWQEFEEFGKQDLSYENPLNPSMDDEERAVDARNKAATVCSLESLKQFIESRLYLDLRKAAFDKKDAILVPAAGACGDCRFRTGFSKDLFDDVAQDDTCTNAECFHKKQDAHLVALKAKLKKAKTRFIEITEDERKPEGHAGAITERSFKYTKPGACKYVRVGIYIDGANKGHTRMVCSEKQKCKVHFGEVIRNREKRHVSSTEPAETKKSPVTMEKERIAEVQKRIKEQVKHEMSHLLHDEVMKSIVANPEKSVLVTLYNSSKELLSSEGNQMLKQFGIKGKPESWGPAVLTRMLLACLAEEAMDSMYDEEELLQFAEGMGVDVKTIEEAVRIEVEKEFAKDLRPTIPGILVEGMCRICGCTEDRACVLRPHGNKGVGACSWVDKSKTLCDNPKCVEAAKKQDTEKKKPKGKAKGVGHLGIVCPTCKAKVGEKCDVKYPHNANDEAIGGIHQRRMDAAEEAAATIAPKRTEKKKAKKQAKKSGSK